MLLYPFAPELNFGRSINKPIDRAITSTHKQVIANLFVCLFICMFLHFHCIFPVQLAKKKKALTLLALETVGALSFAVTLNTLNAPREINYCLF